MDYNQLVERYEDPIAGVISCFDRVILQGRMPILSYADGMTRYLTAGGIKIFDFIKWAQPFTEELKQHAEEVTEAAGLTMEFVRKKTSASRSGLRLC